MTHDEALMIVNEEYQEAVDKWGATFKDNEESLIVMTEEFNEVLEAFKHNDINGKHGVITEAAQLAAVCLKMIEGFPTPDDWIGPS